MGETAAPTKEIRRRREADELDGEVLDAIGRGWDDPLSEGEFDELCRGVFSHQFRFNPVYRQFCLLQGVSAPADVESWKEIPPTPAGAFKVGRWSTFPDSVEAAEFRTSGTTQGDPGTHHFETLGLYNAAVVASARHYLLPDREQIRLLLLSPTPSIAPHSSLVHMFAVYREALGIQDSEFFLTGETTAEGVRLEALTAALDESMAAGEPVLVAGAALAYHHVLDALGDRCWLLPPGSRAMVTGGYKGSRVHVDPADLSRAIDGRLGIPEFLQVEEYGMTELSTQCYEARIRNWLGEDGEGGAGFEVPPWARVRLVDPISGIEVEKGAEGVIVFYDPVNRGSAAVVQTSDLASKVDEARFTLRGREPGAEARGCSLAVDLWLDRE